MFNSGQIYTVHEKPDAADPADRLVLVREGFAFWAFVLNALWLLAHKLWIPFCYYVLLIGATLFASHKLGLNNLTLAIIQLGIQYLLALSARDLQRWQLARDGYAMTGIVVAPSELLATQRAYDLRAA